MRPRFWHRWSAGAIGGHRPSGAELVLPLDPTAPRLLRCECRWVLAVDLAAFLEQATGVRPRLPGDGLLWAPRWVLEDALREGW